MFGPLKGSAATPDECHLKALCAGGRIAGSGVWLKRVLHFQDQKQIFYCHKSFGSPLNVFYGQNHFSPVKICFLDSRFVRLWQ
jgi:hypothetical protein